MAYAILQWKDEVRTPARTYKLIDNSDGTFTLEPAGEELQKGTNMSAANFQNMETGIFAANMTANEAIRRIGIIMDLIGGQSGYTEYSFDNKLLALEALRRIRFLQDDIQNVEDLMDETGKTNYSYDNKLIALEAMRRIRILQDGVDAAKGFILTGTLTNSKKFPFNDSKTTLAIPTANGRNNTDYTVQVEAEAVGDGFVRDIEITDKMVNGFKIAFTGSAEKVSVKCYVQGGM